MTYAIGQLNKLIETAWSIQQEISLGSLAIEKYTAIYLHKWGLWSMRTLFCTWFHCWTNYDNILRIYQETETNKTLQELFVNLSLNDLNGGTVFQVNIYQIIFFFPKTCLNHSTINTQKCYHEYFYKALHIIQSQNSTEYRFMIIVNSLL